MANTILNQIVDNLKTALAAISTGSGYETTVESVYEPLTVEGYSKPPMLSYQIQLTLTDPERNEEMDLVGNPPRIGWNQPMEMFLIYRPSDAATTPIRTVLNKFWADVIKATYLDPQRGGLALNTEITAPTWFLNEDDGIVGISCEVVIQYRHKENNPYEN